MRAPVCCDTNSRSSTSNCANSWAAYPSECGSWCRARCHSSAPYHVGLARHRQYCPKPKRPSVQALTSGSNMMTTWWVVTKSLKELSSSLIPCLINQIIMLLRQETHQFWNCARIRHRHCLVLRARGDIGQRPACLVAHLLIAIVQFRHQGRHQARLDHHLNRWSIVLGQEATGGGDGAQLIALNGRLEKLEDLLQRQLRIAQLNLLIVLTLAQGRFWALRFGRALQGRRVHILQVASLLHLLLASRFTQLKVQVK